MFSSSSSRLSFPSKAIWLIVGFSTTVMTSRPASGITVTSSKSPVSKRLPHREVELLGLTGWPASMPAKTRMESASMRWLPATSIRLNTTVPCAKVNADGRASMSKP